MDDVLRKLYNEVPYENFAFSWSHPRRLGAVARLAGLEIAPPEHARVLEVGCALGGNIIPMAAALPEAQFVGVDLSEQQIAHAQKTADALQLRNLRLLPMSILDIDRTFGEFDYIIAHGFYSWVPLAVREKLLSICSQNLARHGVAYISYDVLPGHAMGMVVRELVLLRVRGSANLHQRLLAIKQVVRLLGSLTAEQQTPYVNWLRVELARVAKFSDATLLHDVLSPVLEPVYFSRFIEQIGMHDLQYVGDAYPRRTALEQLPPEVVQRVRRLTSSFVEQEQWADALAEQGHRRSVLCHRSAVLQRTAAIETVRSLHVACAARAEWSGAMPQGQVHFSVPHGKSIGTSDPLAKALVTRLIDAWPQSLSVETLIAEHPTSTAEKICSTLAAMAPFELVEFELGPPKLMSTVTERPEGFGFARLQAAAGQELTNLRHAYGPFSRLHQLILAQLNGQHTHAQIVEMLRLRLGSTPVSVTDSAGNAVSTLEGAVEMILEDLACASMLVG